MFTREINFSGQRQGSGRRPLGFEIIGISGLFRKGVDQLTAKGSVARPKYAAGWCLGGPARCAGVPVPGRRALVGKEVLVTLSTVGLFRSQGAGLALDSPSPG